MKKVLILAYEFPPYVSVAGLRPLSWAKYSSEFGVHSTIVTRQWDNKFGSALDYIAPGKENHTMVENKKKYTIVKAPYFPTLSNRLLLKFGDQKFSLIRKLNTAILEILQYYFPVGSKRTLCKAADEYLVSHKVDAIIATGDPFVLFHYASKLSKKHNIPWIADYRDTWSNDISINKQHLFKLVSRIIEKRTLRTCSQITTVSDFIAQKITEVNNKTASVLPNGFDPEVVAPHKNKDQKSDVLRIAHAGSIFDWHPYKQFLITLARHIEKDKTGKIELIFYGLNNKAAVQRIIKEYPSLKNAVRIFPKMPNSDLIGALKECNVTLLFNYYSFMGTKIYDYLAVERRILLCFENDPVAEQLKKQHYTVQEPKNLSNSLQKDLVEKCNAGIVVQDSKHLEVVLQELQEEFNSKGSISWKGNHVDNYSRKFQVKKMCEIIKTTSN